MSYRDRRRARHHVPVAADRRRDRIHTFARRVRALLRRRHHRR